MPANIHIAVDAMSGDFGPRSAMLAAQKTLLARPTLWLTLVGDLSILSQLPSHSRIRLVSTTSVVAMDDTPAFALRHGRNSSMAIALQQVANNKAAACVSAGNTGAMVALACHLLKRLPGISRPALCKLLPSTYKPSLMLDLGANTQATPEQLLQFAAMGSAYYQALFAKARGDVRVALLNIGTEAIKGLESIRSAAELLSASDEINYRGYVEADQLFEGAAEVIVCDGFTGNIALKACEGTSRYILAVANRTMRESFGARLQAFFALPLLARWRHCFAPDSYNGACLLGLRGVVVKSHGDAGVDAMCSAIDVAYEQVQCQLLSKIENQLLAMNSGA